MLKLSFPPWKLHLIFDGNLRKVNLTQQQSAKLKAWSDEHLHYYLEATQFKENLQKFKSINNQRLKHSKNYIFLNEFRKYTSIIEIPIIGELPALDTINL